MDTRYIRIERRRRVTWIILDRPEVMNAIHPDMHHELQAAFDDFAADAAQHVAVLTGAGERAFSAGSDLKQTAAGNLQPYPRSGYGGIVERSDLYKPVIAAVNGVCFGGGFEIALACDIIVATETARFGLPEPRVGAIALAGGIHRLARDIGLKRAMRHLLTCEPMTAREGEALGFVAEVVVAGALEAAVERWCDRILESSPIAIRTTKEVALRGLAERDVAAAIRRQQAYRGFKAWLASDDIVEGPRAFAEKREPAWRTERD